MFNLSQAIDEEMLKDLIIEHIGTEPVNIHLIQHLTRFVPGYALIQFASPEDAVKAVTTLHGFHVSGRSISVVYSNPTPPNFLRTELRGKTTVLTFGNIRYDCDEVDIIDAIEKYCGKKFRPIKVIVYENQKGFRTGKAKLIFSSPEEAIFVQNQMNNKVLNSKVIHVSSWIFHVFFIANLLCLRNYMI
ncbi:polyadenylate-binding protein 4 [Reticulomyxa filosa]|uniref:Polyadenylate-binding protein 4 n=1 Tax=Reticulomyxa filosa TaxID=46433 RepID=X6ND21_RETFI|nr:polyadenylate-binding protein 4 [Reticulomyxa filosa]|eukprot:ETO23856.1 polyadenylate-binding protein 4 [Reticulomyxa filosa]